MLKASGRLEEAEHQYRATSERFPENVVARNGLASVLLLRGNASEALLLVAKDARRQTMNDWIALHIHAMILLRLGQFTDARLLLRTGLQNCPWPVSRTYFRRALSVIDLRANQPKMAIEDLGEEESTLTNLLRFHAFSQVGNLDSARQCLRKATLIPFPKCAELKQALQSRYLHPGETRITDNALYEIEFECLLAA